MESIGILQAQREFFAKGTTLDYKYRIKYLKKLREAILKYNDKICEALHYDLGKSQTEAYMSEIGLVLDDLRYQVKHLKKMVKPRKVKTPLAQFKSKSFRYPSPYGNVLVIAPWNYPFLLSVGPLVGAIAAGNTVMLKPSEFSEKTSAVIKEMLDNVFESEYVYTALGDASVAEALLKEKYDYIFFTGGTKIGKIVYKCASEHLTPVTLELGGKSPVIVDETAKIDLAAKRIAFGKFLNCGQTCVAPDYIIVHDSIKEKFISSLTKWVKQMYNDAMTNENYGHIINERHFNRLISYIDNDKIIYGGRNDISRLKIEPTILYPITDEDKPMQEEIFGPILPVLVYKSEEELFNIINNHKTPLALYLFTTNKSIEKKILSSISFGGGCINDTIIHLATSEMPFGGVGNSGIGGYHGKYSFYEFSHYKSILKKANWLDLPMRYAPYTKSKEKMIKIFLK